MGSTAGMRCVCNHSRKCLTRSSMARRCMPAGISSESNSSSNSPGTGCVIVKQASGVGAGKPHFAACLGERSNPQDVGGAFGDADRAAGVEQIEQMARLQALIVSRERQAAIDEAAAFLLGIGEMSGEAGGIGELEIVSGELSLSALEDIAVSHPLSAGRTVVIEIKDAFDALNKHREPFGPVGQLRRNRVAIDAADLLKIGELADLHPVEPNLPAETPSAQSRALPIVLNKAKVVQLRVDADRCEAREVKILTFRRCRLQDHLKLIEMLQPVGVLAIAAIGRTAGRLHIGGAPGFGPQRT